MEEIIAVIAIIGLIIFGVYCGIVIYQDALALQNNLEKVTENHIDLDVLSVPYQASQEVRVSEVYTLEVYLNEAFSATSYTSLLPLDVKQITLTIGGNLRNIDILGSTQFTTAVPLQSATLVQPPQIFSFRVRDDVQALPAEILINVTLTSDSGSLLGEGEIPSSVYHDGDFLRHHWWHFVFFTITALAFTAFIILLVIFVFGQSTVAGAIVLILLIIVGIQLYPPLKQIIETVIPFLKLFLAT